MVASAENHSSHKSTIYKSVVEVPQPDFTKGYFLFRFDREHISDRLLFVFENRSALLRYFVSR
jgi:hypothetical protein